MDRRKWERSFPAAQTNGVDWVLEVVEDLADFAKEEGLHELEIEFSALHVRIVQILKNHQNMKH